jgi:hypothetical protein
VTDFRYLESMSLASNALTEKGSPLLSPCSATPSTAPDAQGQWRAHGARRGTHLLLRVCLLLCLREDAAVYPASTVLLCELRTKYLWLDSIGRDCRVHLATTHIAMFSVFLKP